MGWTFTNQWHKGGDVKKLIKHMWTLKTLVSIMMTWLYENQALEVSQVHFDINCKVWLTCSSLTVRYFIFTGEGNWTNATLDQITHWKKLIYNTNSVNIFTCFFLHCFFFYSPWLRVSLQEIFWIFLRFIMIFHWVTKKDYHVSIQRFNTWREMKKKNVKHHLSWLLLLSWFSIVSMNGFI